MFASPLEKVEDLFLLGKREIKRTKCLKSIFQLHEFFFFLLFLFLQQMLQLQNVPPSSSSLTNLFPRSSLETYERSDVRRIVVKINSWPAEFTQFVANRGNRGEEGEGGRGGEGRRMRRKKAGTRW